MLKENNNPYARLKYLLLVPVFAIAVSVFAHPELSRIDELSDAESTEKIAIEQNKLNYPSGAFDLKSSNGTYSQKEVEKTDILSENNADLQNPSGDPSDTINLKKYKVVAYKNGKIVNFKQWKDFERKDGNILITTDSARYYRNDELIGYTIGGTLHIPENTGNLSGEKVQRKMISAFALPSVKRKNMVDAAGGQEGFLNSIDLKKFRVEAYRNGKRINFDQWKNFRVETHEQKTLPNGLVIPQNDYIVVDIDSAIYYNGNKVIGRESASPGPFQQNIDKNTKNLSGETIQRGLIARVLLQKGINPNE